MHWAGNIFVRLEIKQPSAQQAGKAGYPVEPVCLCPGSGALMHPAPHLALRLMQELAARSINPSGDAVLGGGIALAEKICVARPRDCILF